MRVKKFEAKNMKDALQMVKKELGPDAVILSARDNRKSFGIGGEASVEITAAVSESTLQKKKFVESRMTAQDRDRFQTSDARTQRRIIEKVVEQRLQENAGKAKRPITSQSYIEIQDDEMESGGSRRTAALERATGRNVRELLQDFSQDFDGAEQWNQRRPARAEAPAPRRSESARPMASEPTPPGALPVSEKALSRIRNAAKEAWQAGLFTSDDDRVSKAQNKSQTSASSQTSVGGMEMVAETQQQSTQEIASLKNEIGRLQKMLEGFQKVPQSFVTMHPGADFGIPYDLSFMFQKLTEAGVTIDHTVDILQQAAKDLGPVQIKKRPIVDAWVARWFLDRTQVVSNPWQGRVHLFVGGSGSGKTSTLVKMASHLVVKEKKKVAVLSTDSFKVGAVDQMKIYCQILNVPFAVIRNRKDWEWVMGQLRHVDHVLVDFPGLQLRDLDEIHLLKSLLPPQEFAAVGHLCVSATSKDGDAYEIARRYKAADYADLVITNLDQSVQHGIIANLQTKTGKPLHSFGIGSRIPEDFEAASKERVLDLIFKLTKLRREMK
jgi:flagellar biosynthesis protein FlhF